MFFKSKKARNEFLYNLRVFLLIIAVIMIWRGVWNFLDFYFLKDYFILSNLLTIVIGLVIIFINDYELDDFI
ncbi:MAG: hypothetical protein PHV23_00615 [Candidatus Gracilibacteria bacterium]|nr:hypothetical protein [Candidatus Gracilibacteria bacterium]